MSSAHNVPSDFDSALEENFATRWGDEPREGWAMTREGEVLYANQKVFVPDFVFQHASGVRVLMEIVGYWTPEYLVAKRKTLDAFPHHRILLAIADNLDWPEDDPDESAEFPDRSGRVTDTIRYKSSIQIKAVLDRLNQRLQD